ncbi:hypothetical protein [Niallia taxi]|uniref:hypothetical protein n=1 Tax=Niallia taxi TaxID=2499688 RepID=UPI0015F3DBE4|nr:hypothetical protein [Niallia taxi]
MFGIVYLEKGKTKGLEEEFKTMKEAEVVAKEMGLEEFKVVPLETQKFDVSKGVFDTGSLTIDVDLKTKH